MGPRETWIQESGSGALKDVRGDDAVLSPEWTLDSILSFMHFQSKEASVWMGVWDAPTGHPWISCLTTTTCRRADLGLCLGWSNHTSR